MTVGADNLRDGIERTARVNWRWHERGLCVLAAIEIIAFGYFILWVFS